MELTQTTRSGRPRMTRGSASRAFTLVELLVVIAIIGVLVALLLPAIQAARETARRATCTNHLKQMGIALHNYHDAHKAFPTGVAGGRVASPENGFGWAVGLLPYLEEQTLYDQLDPPGEPDIFRTVFDTTGAIMKGGDTVLEVFRCPTSELDSHATHEDLPEYAVGYATSDYKGCNGSDAEGTGGHGIFCTVKELWHNNRRTKLAMKDVTDGLSKTIAIGESAYYSLKQIDDVWGWPFWIGGVVEDESVLFKTNADCPINCEISPIAIAGFATAKDDSCAFSWHAGGAQFLFGDGSVHFLPETIDAPTYESLGNIADGNVVTDFR